MTIEQLLLKAAETAPLGPSPFQQEFLREQVCTVPILGKVVCRYFIGV